jgi:DNA ligase-1
MINQTVVQILEALEKTSKRTEKETILKQHVKNVLLRQVFVAAMDPYTNYGITKFKKCRPVAQENGGSDVLLEAYLTRVLPVLASREVSGNAARDVIEKTFSTFNADEQKWAERILLHNLRCGVQEKTVNKIWPGTISPYAVQLAVPLEHHVVGEKIVLDEPIVFPVLVEPKLDGLRLTATKEKGVVTLRTRNGTELDTFPSLINFLTETDGDDYVLDAEAMGADWNESASVLMSRKRSKDDKNMVYNLFDALTLQEWKTQDCKRTQGTRRTDMLSLWNQRWQCGPIKPTDAKLCHNLEEVQAYYVECVNAGYEGVMIKDPNGLYTFDRTKAWRKLKPFTTYEGVVVGWYEGKRGTKREGDFGGFNVLLPNGVVTNVGSGFSDDEKAEINNDPTSWIGKIVEVKGQPPLTDDGKVRFPSKVRYREASDVDPKVLEAYEAWSAR